MTPIQLNKLREQKIREYIFKFGLHDGYIKAHKEVNDLARRARCNR